LPCRLRQPRVLFWLRSDPVSNPPTPPPSYEYKPENGDPDFPVAKGVLFQVWRGTRRGPEEQPRGCSTDRSGGAAAAVALCAPVEHHLTTTTTLGLPSSPAPPPSPQQDLPEDYVCPICGAAKSRFESRVKTVAGFAENQQYGFGTNSMTGNQKLLLIYGSLLLFVAFFLAGYALE
jgi:rubredoxin